MTKVPTTSRKKRSKNIQKIEPTILIGVGLILAQFILAFFVDYPGWLVTRFFGWGSHDGQWLGWATMIIPMATGVAIALINDYVKSWPVYIGLLVGITYILDYALVFELFVRNWNF